MCVNTLLERLKHKKVKEGQWVAVCPAHNDKSPSLHVKENEDGRVLIHCKAGCGANEVISAINLTWDALFPDTKEHYGAWRPKVEARDLDDFVVEIFESTVECGKPVSSTDKARYREALLKGAKRNGFVDEVLKHT